MILNIDDLKNAPQLQSLVSERFSEAIAQKKKMSIQCDPDEINIYLWSEEELLNQIVSQEEDNQWIKQDEWSPIARGATPSFTQFTSLSLFPSF